VPHVPNGSDKTEYVKTQTRHLLDESRYKAVHTLRRLSTCLVAVWSGCAGDNENAYSAALSARSLSSKDVTEVCADQRRTSHAVLVHAR